MAQVTFQGNPVHTSGQLPAKGTQAPDFKCVDKELKERSLQDYRGKRKLISWLPSLDTAVCSLSAKKFNDKIKAHPEVAMLIISADSPFAQSRLCSQEKLANVITLSIVRSKEGAKNYGVLMTDGPLEGFCARAVVVVDEKDHVVYTELVPEITQEPNYDKALEALIPNF